MIYNMSVCVKLTAQAESRGPNTRMLKVKFWDVKTDL